MALSNAFRLSFAIAALCTILLSCENENPTTDNGKIEFSFSEKNQNSGGRTNGSATSIVITIKDSKGKLVYEKKKIALFQFSGEFLSEPVDLKPGNYALTEFLVLDENNAVIFATPLEGSDLAHLVDDPLPIGFSIAKEQTIKISPQVVSTANITPSEFGYATFTFDIVNTFSFHIAVFAYNEVSKNFELTSSSITLSSTGAAAFAKDLPANTSTIILKDIVENYTLTVSKSNYAMYSKTFSVAELKAFNTENKPLIINLLKQSSRDGLVGEYLFNNNTHDTSGKNHHGTPQGATLTTDRKGFGQSAYFFSGANQNYITIPDNTDMNFSSSQNYSISLWVLANNQQTNESNINDIFRKWNGDAQGYPFGLSYLNEQQPVGQQNKFLHVRYDGSSCGNVPASYSPAANTNIFHHIVLTKEGSVLRHYLNNILVDELVDNASCNTTNNANITIGARSSLVRFFTGKIDDIRVYNRKLTTSEIDALFKE